MPRRYTFCRLHVIIWLVLVASVVVLWQAQSQNHTLPVFETDTDFLDAISNNKSFLGWPSHMVTHIPHQGPYTRPSPPLDRYEWHSTGAARNIAVCGLLLTATVFLLERCLRSDTRWQFHLSTILKLMTAAAIMIAVIRQPAISLGISQDLSFGIRSTFPHLLPFKPPWHLQIPLALGILCTIYVALDFSLWLARRSFLRLRSTAT